MENSTSVLERAGAWFLRSGIQEPGGGVARYYRSDLSSNSRISSEITGYAIGALLFPRERARHEEYREAARRAADFLMAKAWSADQAIFPFEIERAGEPPCRLAYFFDMGIVVRGLLAASRGLGEKLYLDIAVAAGRSMMKYFRAADAVHPIISLPERAPMAEDQRWSARPGCYQLKAALAWRQLHEATGEDGFEDAWEACLDAALRSHESFLPGAADQEKVMDRLHAYCYFLEGLLPCLERPPCARALSEGMDRASHFLRQIAPRFERSDVYAQLLRLRVYAASGTAAINAPAAASEAEHLLEFQIESEDPRLDGGFWFGRKRGDMMPYVSPVATAFAAQALALWEDHSKAASTPNWRDLV